MAATYCAVTDVQRMLQKKTAFGAGTTPTSDQVTSNIEEAQDEIDQRTQHSWRSVTVTNEFYNLPETYNYGGPGTWQGLRVKLRHRQIVALSSGTDKIEIWDGSNYVDWVATKTEGRADDWWIDHEAGVLYIRLLYPWFIDKAVRMTYRYDGSNGGTIPADIKKACALIASIKVLQSDDQSMPAQPETGDPTRLPYDGRISQWTKEIDRILAARTEFNTISA